MELSNNNNFKRNYDSMNYLIEETENDTSEYPGLSIDFIDRYGLDNLNLIFERAHSGKFNLNSILEGTGINSSEFFCVNQINFNQQSEMMNKKYCLPNEYKNVIMAYLYFWNFLDYLNEYLIPSTNEIPVQRQEVIRAFGDLQKILKLLPKQNIISNLNQGESFSNNIFAPFGGDDNVRENVLKDIVIQLYSIGDWDLLLKLNSIVNNQIFLDNLIVTGNLLPGYIIKKNGMDSFFSPNTELITKQQLDNLPDGEEFYIVPSLASVSPSLYLDILDEAALDSIENGNEDANELLEDFLSVYPIQKRVKIHNNNNNTFSKNDPGVTNLVWEFDEDLRNYRFYFK